MSKQKGIPSDKIKQKIRSHREKLPSAEAFANGIKNQDFGMLSRAITLLESSKTEHRQHVQEVVDLCLPEAGNAIRIGITGVPGVGKSTFIEAFGKCLLKQGKKLAILAIDPSSSKSGGSILGDKTRMEELSSKENVFIRPSPSRGSLGGVAQATRESITLCEAAGFDVVIIETVGVGQSETTVHWLVDFFLLLMLAGAGDELQGIKRGIMEMADAIAITKTDGDNIRKANQARKEYQNALHLFPPSEDGWTPKVETCSAMENKGMLKIWKIIQAHHQELSDKGFLTAKRKDQAKFWLHEAINQELRQNFFSQLHIKEQLSAIENKVMEGEISPFSAAQLLTKNSLL